MRGIFAILFTIYFSQSLCQQEDVYVDVSTTTIAKDFGGNTPPPNFTLNNGLEFGRYVFDAFVNEYRDKKLREAIREQSMTKLSMLKKHYDSYESYPDTISNGWHRVIVTDNLDFCQEAKVLVEENRIKQFVIENCITLNFQPASSIKKGKCLGTISNYKQEATKIVDIYFIYDLEFSAVVEPPQEPGYMTLWTNSSNYLDMRIALGGRFESNGLFRTAKGGNYLDPFTKRFKKRPNCFSTGAINLILPAGGYNVMVRRKGRDYMESFEIKRGQCLIFYVY